MLFGNKFLKYKEEFLNDLNTLLSIQSIASEHPDECERAMDFIIKRATDFGLTAEKITDKSMHIELGNGEKLCGVLSHLDVVPEGSGWSVEPFALTRKNGRLYGRGVADDKGAALVNLYCLRALKEEKITGQNTVRAIFGTSEEIGMDDMDGYFKKQPIPELCFTPDSDYGICYAEKGILQLYVSSEQNDATLLNRFHAGNAVNAVPEIANCIIDSSEYTEENLIKNADSSDGSFEFKSSLDGLLTISRGKAAHACEPHKGFNAAASLIKLLATELDSNELGSLCSFINYAIGTETNGRSLGLKMSDAPSGKLTVNLACVNIDDNSAFAKFDIRYPVTVKHETVLNQFKKVAALSNLNVKVIKHEKPLYVEKSSELIDLLSQAYENVTGEKPELFSTGGGTYARALNGHGVAFGPCFKSDDVRMHNSDESIDEDNFFTHAQICLEALYKMFTNQ